MKNKYKKLVALVAICAATAGITLACKPSNSQAAHISDAQLYGLYELCTYRARRGKPEILVQGKTCEDIMVDYGRRRRLND